MLEAVNSVLQSAPLTRGNAEQQSGARSFAANPVRIQETAKAPYISPHISLDLDHDKAVIQIRDSDTGEVLSQIPTDAKLEAQASAQREAQSFESIRAQVTSGSDKAPRAGAGEDSGSAAPPPQPQQLAAFQSAAQAATAGNGSNVSLLA